MVKFWIVAVFTVFVDLGSKTYIFGKLINTPGQRLDLIDNWLAFTLHINRGAVWGVGGGRPILLIAITAIIIPIVIYLAHSASKNSKSFIPLLGFGMLLGGALGNLYDRVFTEMQLNGYLHSYQGVRDFIDVQIPGVYSWPVFNIADVAIVMGVAVFVFWNLTDGGKKKSK